MVSLIHSEVSVRSPYKTALGLHSKGLCRFFGCPQPIHAKRLNVEISDGPPVICFYFLYVFSVPSSSIEPDHPSLDIYRICMKAFPAPSCFVKCCGPAHPLGKCPGGQHTSNDNP